jgi:hypothetical protein
MTAAVIKPPILETPKPPTPPTKPLPITGLLPEGVKKNLQKVMAETAVAGPTKEQVKGVDKVVKTGKAKTKGGPTAQAMSWSQQQQAKKEAAAKAQQKAAQEGTAKLAAIKEAYKTGALSEAAIKESLQEWLASTGLSSKTAALKAEESFAKMQKTIKQDPPTDETPKIVKEATAKGAIALLPEEQVEKVGTATQKALADWAKQAEEVGLSQESIQAVIEKGVLSDEQFLGIEKAKQIKAEEKAKLQAALEFQAQEAAAKKKAEADALAEAITELEGKKEEIAAEKEAFKQEWSPLINADDNTFDGTSQQYLNYKTAKGEQDDKIAAYNVSVGAYNLAAEAQIQKFTLAQAPVAKYIVDGKLDLVEALKAGVTSEQLIEIGIGAEAVMEGVKALGYTELASGDLVDLEEFKWDLMLAGKTEVEVLAKIALLESLGVEAYNAAAKEKEAQQVKAKEAFDAQYTELATGEYVDLASWTKDLKAEGFNEGEIKERVGLLTTLGTKGYKASLQASLPPLETVSKAKVEAVEGLTWLDSQEWVDLEEFTKALADLGYTQDEIKSRIDTLKSLGTEGFNESLISSIPPSSQVSEQATAYTALLVKGGPIEAIKGGAGVEDFLAAGYSQETFDLYKEAAGYKDNLQAIVSGDLSDEELETLFTPDSITEVKDYYEGLSSEDKETIGKSGMAGLTFQKVQDAEAKEWQLAKELEQLFLANLEVYEEYKEDLTKYPDSYSEAMAKVSKDFGTGKWVFGTDKFWGVGYEKGSQPQPYNIIMQQRSMTEKANPTPDHLPAVVEKWASKIKPLPAPPGEEPELEWTGTKKEYEAFAVEIAEADASNYQGAIPEIVSYLEDKLAVYEAVGTPEEIKEIQKSLEKAKVNNGKLYGFGEEDTATSIAMVLPFGFPGKVLGLVGKAGLAGIKVGSKPGMAVTKLISQSPLGGATKIVLTKTGTGIKVGAIGAKKGLVYVTQPTISYFKMTPGGKAVEGVAGLAKPMFLVPAAGVKEAAKELAKFYTSGATVEGLLWEALKGAGKVPAKGLSEAKIKAAQVANQTAYKLEVAALKANQTSQLKGFLNEGKISQAQYDEAMERFTELVKTYQPDPSDLAKWQEIVYKQIVAGEKITIGETLEQQLKKWGTNLTDLGDDIIPSGGSGGSIKPQPGPGGGGGGVAVLDKTATKVYPKVQKQVEAILAAAEVGPPSKSLPIGLVSQPIKGVGLQQITGTPLIIPIGAPGDMPIATPMVSPSIQGPSIVPTAEVVVAEPEVEVTKASPEVFTFTDPYEIPTVFPNGNGSNGKADWEEYEVIAAPPIEPDTEAPPTPAAVPYIDSPQKEPVELPGEADIPYIDPLPEEEPIEVAEPEPEVVEEPTPYEAAYEEEQAYQEAYEEPEIGVGTETEAIPPAETEIETAAGPAWETEYWTGTGPLVDPYTEAETYTELETGLDLGLGLETEQELGLETGAENWTEAWSDYWTGTESATTTDTDLSTVASTFNAVYEDMFTDPFTDPFPATEPGVSPTPEPGLGPKPAPGVGPKPAPAIKVRTKEPKIPKIKVGIPPLLPPRRKKDEEEEERRIGGRTCWRVRKDPAGYILLKMVRRRPIILDTYPTKEEAEEQGELLAIPRCRHTDKAGRPVPEESFLRGSAERGIDQLDMVVTLRTDEFMRGIR